MYMITVIDYQGTVKVEANQTISTHVCSQYPKTNLEIVKLIPYIQNQAHLRAYIYEIKSFKTANFTYFLATSNRRPITVVENECPSQLQKYRFVFLKGSQPPVSTSLPVESLQGRLGPILPRTKAICLLDTWAVPFYNPVLLICNKTVFY